MTHLLILALIAALYLAKQARDERDALRLELLVLRYGNGSPPTEWQRADDRLAAERRIWQQAAALHQSARHAMRDVVATPDVEPSPHSPPPIVVRPTSPIPGSPSMMPPWDLTPDERLRAMVWWPR